MKKILLFDTALGTSNIGDEIILDGVKEGMKSLLSDSMCFRLATHIENYSPLQMIYPGQQIFDICFDADYKFIAGTNLLSDNLFHIRPQWWINCFNKKLYKDSILVGVGKTTNYLKIKNKYTKRIYKEILSKEYRHSVRDEATKRIVESLGLKAINTGCPTLWGFTNERCRIIPKEKGKNVIFSVSGYRNQIDPLSDTTMLKCLLKNYDTCYAWIQTTKDENYLTTLLDKSALKKIKFLYSLIKFRDIAKEGNVDYVGTRLHGGIFALQNSIRTLIISIDQRAEGFYESNNIPIIRRENMCSLEDRINESYETNIIVNHDGIKQFISQFL